MTVFEFRGLVWHLANGGWCRYWLDFDCKQTYSKMVFQVIDFDGKSQPVPDAVKHGFRELPNNMYEIDRTNEDGTSHHIDS